MNNTFTRILVFIPLVILATVSYLKWTFFNNSTTIFLIASAVCISTSLSLMLYSRIKYKARIHSVAATMLSLLAMQKVAGFTLVIVAILAFTWLIDFVREIPELEQSPYFLLTGAIFSLSLMFIVAGIVVFIEKQKLEQLKKSSKTIPKKTKGLILSLSLLGKNHSLDKFIEELEKNKMHIEKIRQICRMILATKSASEIEDISAQLTAKQIPESSIEIFRQFSQTSFYPLFLAIEHHSEQLENLWLLLTPEARGSAFPFFEKLIKIMYEKIKLRKIDIEDPDNVNAICKTVDELYSYAHERFGYDESEITADITSGPASATSGITLACVRSKRQVQYLGRRTMNLQSIEVNVRSIPHLFDELIDQIEIIRAMQ